MSLPYSIQTKQRIAAAALGIVVAYMLSDFLHPEYSYPVKRHFQEIFAPITFLVFLNVWQFSIMGREFSFGQIFFSMLVLCGFSMMLLRLEEQCSTLHILGSQLAIALYTLVISEVFVARLNFWVWIFIVLTGALNIGLSEFGFSQFLYISWTSCVALIPVFYRGEIVPVEDDEVHKKSGS